MEELTEQQEQTETTAQSLPLEKYKGVKGWLLILCVYLTIILPLSAAGGLALSYAIVTDPELKRVSGLRETFIIDCLLSLVVVAFGIRAAIALWRVQSKAIEALRLFLVMFIAYTVLSVALPFMPDAPPGADKAAIVGPALGGGTVRFVIWSAISSYLRYSKRIKATYGVNG